MAEILIIDDEECIRDTFARFLSDEGHKVSTASDYAEGTALISGGDFDLVFSDIILGGRTGIDILRGVREKDLIYPVVMITGYPTVETAAEAVRLGAFDYLLKPVEQETLLHITRLALEYKKVLDEKIRYRQHLDAVFSSIEDGILTVDKDLTVLEMNRAAENICGLSRDLIGMQLGRSSVRGSEKFFESLRETIDSGSSVKVSRFEFSTGKGVHRILSLSTCPLINRQGSFKGAVMIVRDETRLASLEQDLMQRSGFHNMVGKSAQMQKIYSLMDSLADVESTVLITGESGTGKELVAEALHYTGARSRGPLVRVNCTALTETLLESELFGHVKGAFTGAVGDRPGRFQKAGGGTIFLDEIGDISMKMQSSLLRVLQEKEFERVGDSKTIKVDVRVIAATNKDLSEKVRSGQFREDLYYRLKVVELALPPLRERREDIPLLIEHFLKQLNEKFHKEIIAVSDDAERIFMAYSWPGNVRELMHALESAFILCDGDTITVGHLPAHLASFRNVEASSRTAKATVDAETILRSLEKTGWNKARASRLLGIDRKTLYRNMRAYNIPERES